VVPFPTPATSHVAGGFPALRAPAHFTFKGYETYPMGTAVGTLPYEPDSNGTIPRSHIAIPESTVSIRSLDA